MHETNIQIKAQRVGQIPLLAIEKPTGQGPAVFTRESIEQQFKGFEAMGIVSYVFLIQWMDSDGILFSLLKFIYKEKKSLCLICPEEPIRHLIATAFQGKSSVEIYGSVDEYEGHRYEPER